MIALKEYRKDNGDFIGATMYSEFFEAYEAALSIQNLHIVNVVLTEIDHDSDGKIFEEVLYDRS